MVDYEKLEAEINKIITVVEKLPDAYRQTSFKVLLMSHLRGFNPPAEADQVPEKTKVQNATTPDLPIDVKAFLMQYTLPDEAIDRLFYRVGNNIRPVYKLPEGSNYKGQIQIALLCALENALKSSDTKFAFSYERVRELCKQYDRYETNKFSGIFVKSKRLFVSLSDKDHVELSPDGKGELAELISELTK